MFHLHFFLVWFWYSIRLNLRKKLNYVYPYSFSVCDCIFGVHQASIASILLCIWACSKKCRQNMVQMYHMNFRLSFSLQNAIMCPWKWQYRIGRGMSLRKEMTKPNSHVHTANTIKSLFLSLSWTIVFVYTKQL